MKIVINKCFGGFGLSQEALQEIRNLDKTLVEESKETSPFHGPLYARYGEDSKSFRSNPSVVSVVERLGEKANGNYASLGVVEVPDGINWGIHDYDGIEHVEEEHRTWG